MIKKDKIRIKIAEYDKKDKIEIKIAEYDKIECRSSDSLMGMAQIESLP